MSCLFHVTALPDICLINCQGVRRLYNLILIVALIAKQLIKMHGDWSEHCPAGCNKAGIINT